MKDFLKTAWEVVVFLGQVTLLVILKMLPPYEDGGGLLGDEAEDA